MRTLERGFGSCSLRTSTFICLIVFLVFNIVVVLGVIGGYSNVTFIGATFTVLFSAIWIALFGYTLYSLNRDDPSMLNVTVIALIIHIVIVILGLLLNIFTAFLSISTYIAVLPYLAFEIYGAWVIYSYSVEFNQPVSVNA